MKDERKTKRQLVAELVELRQRLAEARRRLAELEAVEAGDRQVVEALPKSAERYRSLFEGVPVGLYRTTPEGRILHANPALVQMLGYPDRRALMEVNVLDLCVDPEEHRREQALLEQEGVVHGFEMQLRRYDGAAIWARGTVRAGCDVRGYVVYYEGSLEDITEHKQADERIEHLNLALRAIRGVNQLITGEKDRDRLLQSACEKLTETRGYFNAWIALLDETGEFVTSAEAGLGDTFLPMIERLQRGELTGCGRRALEQAGVVTTDDPPVVCADCPLAMSYGGRGAMTVRLEHGGKVYGLLSVSIPAHLAADEEERVLFEEVAEDIASALHSIELEEERVWAEEERERLLTQVERERDNLRTLVDNIADEVWFCDAEGNLTLANVAAARGLGFDRAEDLYQAMPEWLSKLEIYTADGQPRAQEDAPLLRSLRGETLKDVEEIVRHPQTGEMLYRQVSSAPLRTEAGQVLGAVAVVHDITKRRQAEAELRLHGEIMTNMAEGVVVTRVSDATIVYTNPKFEEMFGYGHGELVGKTISVVNALTEKSPEEVAEDIQRTLEKTGVWSGEVYNIKKDDTPFWCHANVSTFGHPEYGTVWVGVHTDITERKRVEEALRESERRYRTIFETTGTATVIVEEDTTISLANAQFEHLSGYSREELEGKKSWTEFVVPEDLERMIGYHGRRRAEPDDVPKTYEFRFVDRQGNVKNILLDVDLIPGTKQSVTSLLDITERVRSERERARAEEATRRQLAEIVSFYDNTPIGLAALDTNLRYLRINDRLAEINGIPAAAHIGKTVKEIVPALEAHALGVTAEILRTGQPITDIEFGGETVAQPGVNRSWLESWHPLEGENGNIVGFTVMVLDITERKRAEEERERLLAQVREQAQQVRQIIDTVPEGVLLLDSDMRVIVANPVAAGDLAVLAGAEVGDTLTHLGDCPLSELLTRPPRGYWHEVTAEDRTPRHFEVIAKAVGGDSAAGGWVLVIRDVTREREVEQQARQQERLAVVGQLAGGIAHDFNNLLTTIMLYAQMPLGKRDLPLDVTRSLETILDESRQAARLVGQILDFSRRSPVRTHSVDLGSLIEKVTEILQRTLPEDIRLGATMSAEKHMVEADSGRIQQVVMNLALNARDAMPEGGELRVGLSRVETEPGADPPVPGMGAGEWVCLAVADTGTGLSDEAQLHLFEPFFTTKGPGKGTGLGLAQVHGIVAQHKGHIGVETEAGKGTTFRIYLPAHPGEVEAATEEIAASPQGRGETILLIEDSAGIREAGRRILESLGYRVLVAADGQEALTIHRSVEDVDLVITDLVMLEMGGRELVQELRKARPDLKALAITGYVMREDLHELRQEGFLDVVHKPFDVDALAKVVRRALDTD